ncbi:MAG: ABC transporter ATP-binding protein [Dehalococcoidia bacterium]|nr:ABC transporter ATP-binding protein [Dehalococcoidia bacterium]
MIELKDVSLGYDHQAILNNINLDTVPGKLLGLIGPNGSGKSTLIKGITRVINLFSGHILIEGQEIESIKREKLARLIATVPQNPVLPEAFTAFEVVLMGRTPHLGLLRYEGESDMAIAWQAMEATQTDFLAERRVGELSGGEKQRLIIARALTQQPKALLLDEPTAHLDISHQVEILDMVKSLCLEQSLTVIAALHDLNLAAQYCDWLVMLNGGRIYTKGTPQDVLTVQNIKKVYGAEVCVYPHPVNSLPTTLITASKDKKGRAYTHK